MKDFRLYDISDFVMDEDFIRWVHEQREEDNLFWTNWLQQNPDKHLLIAEARLVVESIQLQETRVGEQEIEMQIGKLLQTVSTQTAQQASPHAIGYRMPSLWIAATLLLMVSAGAWYWMNRAGAKHPFVYTSMVARKHLFEHTNTTEAPVLLSLPDGSRITLMPQSRISYAQNMNTSAVRDVYLLGEAFFEVTKNPHRPFRVFANEIVTKVLGTSFSIRSFERDTSIRVIVRTGKVSVYAQAAATDSGKKSEIILTPNQQLVYEKSAQKFQKILLDSPAMIVPPVMEQSMVYDDAPLEKVFNDLSKAYGINIVCDSEVMEKCTVTADLKNEPFYHKLDLVCRAIGARYELIDGQVVIESAGCR